MKYNRWYGNRWKRIARYRIGNEMRGSRYWEGEESVDYVEGGES